MKPLYTTRRDAGSAWLERSNPLRGLSIREAQSIFDAARDGNTQRLHWLYAEVERANPTLLTCVERRAAAVAALDWTVSVRPDADQALGDEQRDAALRFLNGIENLSEAVEHLDLAFFRGVAHAQPLWEADGSVRRISLLDSWLFLERDGKLLFNPACDGFSANAVEVTPDAALLTLRRRREIDHPALAIHIREAVGERDWGRFLERIALPKPAVFMAPNATDDDRKAYVAAAEQVEDGMVSVWPSGSAITDFMGASRGQDPFSAFVRHQEERIVLLSTGGTLTSLAESGSGTLAGAAQMDVWREIVARDAVAIEGVLSRGLLTPFLKRAFPGQPVAVDLSLGREKKPTALETAQLAATLRSAGYAVDRDELEEAVGFSLSEAEVTPASSPLALAKATAAPRTRIQTPTAGALATAPQLRGSSAASNKRSVSEASDESELNDKPADLAQTLDDAIYAAMAAAIEEELGKEKGGRE